MRVMRVMGVAGVTGVTGVGLAAGQLPNGGDKTHCRKNRNRARDEYYKHRSKHVVVIVTR